MKTRATLFLLFFGIRMFAQQVPGVNPNGPVIKFETEVIDYGTINKGADGVREFKFTNTGKEKLVLSNVQSSCGCLTATWPKEPILPGKSAVIKALYDTNRVGRFEKTLTITSNADRPSIVLKIKGNVIEPK